MQRSYCTAEIAFAHRNIPIIKDPRLRECDYGEFTRHSTDLVERERPHRVTVPFPGGESYAQAAARVRSLLEDLMGRYSGQRIMLVGHRATQYALEHWLNDVPLEVAVVTPFVWQPRLDLPACQRACAIVVGPVLPSVIAGSGSRAPRRWRMIASVESLQGEASSES